MAWVRIHFEFYQQKKSYNGTLGFRTQLAGTSTYIWIVFSSLFELLLSFPLSEFPHQNFGQKNQNRDCNSDSPQDDNADHAIHSQLGRPGGVVVPWNGDFLLNLVVIVRGDALKRWNEAFWKVIAENWTRFPMPYRSHETPNVFGFRFRKLSEWIDRERLWKATFYTTSPRSTRNRYHCAWFGGASWRSRRCNRRQRNALTQWKMGLWIRMILQLVRTVGVFDGLP